MIARELDVNTVTVGEKLGFRVSIFQNQGCFVMGRFLLICSNLSCI